MSYDLSDIARTLANLIRTGIIAEVDGDKARVQLAPNFSTKRAVDAALEKMSWSSWWKIYESIAVDHVRAFAAQYVPAGVDLSQDDSDIVATAEKAAANVVKMLWTAQSEQHALDLIGTECADYGIEAPDFEDDPTAVIARAIDARWWRRQLRKRVKRAFEAGNIKLGYVHYRGEPYATVLRRTMEGISRTK